MNSLDVVKVSPAKYKLTIRGANKESIVLNRWELVEILEAAIYQKIPKEEPLMEFLKDEVPPGVKITKVEPYWFRATKEEIPMAKVYYEWKGAERFSNIRMTKDLMPKISKSKNVGIV